MKKPSFPVVDRSISDFLMEEEANISRKKILSVGTMLILVTLFLSTDVFAKHSSHRSHSSHSSHVSGHLSGHQSHSSHQSHESHVSSSYHSSHSSSVHSNHASHSSAVHSNHASHSSSDFSHLSGGETSVDSGEISRDIFGSRIPQIPPDSPDMNIPNDITGG